VSPNPVYTVPAAGLILKLRYAAAGMCHSDAHYRRGVSPVGDLPVTPGHEVFGVSERVGDGMQECRIGERVCLHYLVTCGRCRFCRTGQEQFCPQGQMIGTGVLGLSAVQHLCG